MKAQLLRRRYRRGEMRDVTRTPSQEDFARLVPPQARAELLDVVCEAVGLLSLAEVVLAGCDQPGTKGPEPARSAGRVMSAFVRMAGRVRSLPVSEPLRSRIAQLLDYHAELIGQALLMAYGERTERTERARAVAVLGRLRSSSPGLPTNWSAAWARRARPRTRRGDA